MVYWDDSYTRLAYRDQLLVGRWLPAVQALVVLTGKLPAGLAVLRVLLAGIASGTVFAVYRYTSEAFGRSAGLLAASLTASHTLFIALSIVPYLEVPFVGLCFAALFFLERAHRPPARAAAYGCILLLNLTRYEAWLFVPIFVLIETRRGFATGKWGGALRTGLPAVLLMSAVPVLWYFFGTYQVLAHEGASMERILTGQVFTFFTGLLGHPWWRTRPDILFFAATGAAAALEKRGDGRRPPWPLALAAVQIGLLALTGVWPPENLRSTFFLTMMLTPYAAHGLLLAAGWTLERMRRAVPALSRSPVPERFLLAAAATGFVGLTYAGIVFVRGADATPVYRAGFAAAEAFGDRAFTGVLVLTDAPVGPYVFASYSDVPLEAIYEAGPTTLDRPLPGVTDQALEAAGISHIVAVYADVSGLSPEETDLLDQLDTGAIAGIKFEVDGVSIWELGP